MTGTTLVTSVPTGDGRGWGATDSTQTLPGGALVTGPRALGVLSTRTGSAAAGAMLTVPEALATTGAAAPGGSVRPAGMPSGTQRQRRCPSRSGGEASRGRRQRSRAQSGRRSIAGHTRAPGPAGGDPAGHSLRQRRPHVRASAPVPPQKRPDGQLPRAVTSVPTQGAFTQRFPAKNFKALQTHRVQQRPTRAPHRPRRRAASHVYIATRSPRARALAAPAGRGFPAIRPSDWPARGLALVTSRGPARGVARTLPPVRALRRRVWEVITCGASCGGGAATRRPRGLPGLSPRSASARRPQDATL